MDFNDSNKFIYKYLDSLDSMASLMTKQKSLSHYGLSFFVITP